MSCVRVQQRPSLCFCNSLNMYEQVLHDIESRDAADYSRPVGALKKVALPPPLLPPPPAPPPTAALITFTKTMAWSRDSRQVEGAVELDSTSMTFQQVVDAIIDIIAQRTKA
jgi:cytidylate kinase